MKFKVRIQTAGTAGMSNANPLTTARIGGHPIHPMLVPFPIVCFVGALVTDLIYWGTAAGQWETFSIWLLTGGLIMAAFAVLAGLIDFVSSARIRSLAPAWPHVIGNALVVLLSIINAFVHSRDGYTAVVPTGLFLSALVVVLMAFTSWLGREMVFRHRVGVTE